MRFGKKVGVELKDDALEAYNHLNKIVGEQKSRGIKNSEEISLWNGIQRAFDLIVDNPFYGRNVKKGRIPQYYMKKFWADNLFIVNLPSFWRMIYTLEGSKVETSETLMRNLLTSVSSQAHSVSERAQEPHAACFS